MLVAFMAVQQEAGSAARLSFYNSRLRGFPGYFPSPNLYPNLIPKTRGRSTVWVTTN